jgi:hypothetical protein
MILARIDACLFLLKQMVQNLLMISTHEKSYTMDLSRHSTQTDVYLDD